MEARFSCEPLPEVVISAECREWRQLAEALRRPSAVVSCELISDPQPYDFSARRVRVEVESGKKFRVAIVGDEIRLRGDSASLAWFAAVAEDMSESVPAPNSGIPDHVHIEPCDGDGCVADDSVPLVLMTKTNFADADG